MRRNNEQTGDNPSELSSQYTVEVVEVPQPRSFPSSSSADGKNIMPAPRAKLFNPAPRGSRDVDGLENSLSAEGDYDQIGDPIDAPEIDTYDMNAEDGGVEDRVIEDMPIEAWYRVVYPVSDSLSTVSSDKAVAFVLVSYQ
jgi:hypothetical protein